MKKIGFIICLFIGCMNVSFAQTQLGQDIVGQVPGDNCGSSISMPDAYTVAIGSWSSSAGAYYGGQTRVFSWDGNNWVQKGSDINGELEGDWSGHSVSMPDANTLAIGIPRHDDAGNDAGKTRVYTWNGIDWVQKGTDIDGEASEDRSGFCVMMPDENTLAIGAPRNDATASDAGHVRIYSWNGTDWTQKGMDIDGEAMWDKSGKAISMPDANTVAIGAFENSQVGLFSGHVRVYVWNGFAWDQKGVDIDGEAQKTWMGYSVSMPDVNTLAIGAPAYDEVELDRGKVRIYKWNAGAWQQTGTDIIGENFADNMGFSVSMPDEFTLAVGVVAKDVTAFEAGQARLYTWDPISSDWAQKGININGTISYDYLGWWVSMPDAGTFAVGARQGGSGPGFVQVYNVCAVNNEISTNEGTISTSATSANYQWLDCDNGYSIVSGETGQNFTPNVNGSYAVEVTYGGCIDTSECKVVNWVGLTEVPFKSTLAIYPNPVKNDLHFDFEHKGNVTIEITDVSGKVLESKSMDNNIIDVKMLPQGFYMLKVCYDNNVVTGRFIKQ